MADQESVQQPSNPVEEDVTNTANKVAAAVESVGSELRAQAYDEEHPLGPFKAPESVEVTGIRENVGYVPRWLVYLFIMAILLSLVLWIRTGGPLS